MTEGEPLGWLARVKVLSESNTVAPVSWFRRVILNEPKPVLQPGDIEVVANEAGLTVLGCVSPIPMNGV